jgi:hypothetical protein
MTTALAVELVEVAEGRWLAVDCCTAGDLEAAKALAAEVHRLRLDLGAMDFKAGRLGADGAEIHLGEDPGSLGCPSEFEQAQLHEVRRADVPRLLGRRKGATGVPDGEVRVEEGALVGREWHEIPGYRSEAAISLGGPADAWEAAGDPDAAR